METILALPLTAGIGIAAAWDLKTRKIPNRLTYPMMFFGLLFHGISDGLAGLGFSGAGLMAGTGIFLIPYLLGGMGAGDAKLMGGVGAVLGFKGVVVAAAISVLIGLAYAIILLIVYHDYRRSFLNSSWVTLKTFFFTRQWIYTPPETGAEKPVLCYALPIALGTLCTILIKLTGSNLIQQVLGFRLSI
jgi:prepilin peptidase CpaA